MEESETEGLVLGSSDPSMQADLLSQEAITGGAALHNAHSVCVHVSVPRRWRPITSGGGRDKQSVWAEIRWEQTLRRLTDCK